MSLQLVLYPQNYNGQYNVTSTPNYSEYVGNYSFFTSGIVSNTYGTSTPWNQFFATSIPNALWHGWHDNGSVWAGAPAPSLSSGRLRLSSAVGIGSWTGARQKITGLTTGAQYDITFELNAASTGTIYFGSNIASYTDTLGVSHNCLVVLEVFANASAGVYTITVTAPSSSAVLDVMFNATDGSFVDFNYISIKENITSVPTTDTYFDGQVICDLYNDESIPLKLSIDEFKNVAEKAQSFSNPFNLPSTKRNNKIFTHLFDTQISVQEDVYAFNPYKKTKAVLKEDGLTIFDGFLSLIDINNKDGEISYNVNLYSDTITLKDTLKDKKLKNLNNGFEELTHLYNKQNIKLSFGATGVTYTSAATSGFRTASTVKYPLCNWNGQITLDNNNNPQLTALEDGYRPWLNCKYLIDRIFDEAGFTFSSTFLNSTDFTKLYMDFNWGGDNELVTGEGTQPATSGVSSSIISATQTQTSFTNLQLDQSAPLDINIPDEIGYDNTNHKFVCPADNVGYKIEYWVNTRIVNATTYEKRWKHTSAATGNIVYYDQSSGSQSAGVIVQDSGIIYIQMNQNDELEFQHKSSSNNDAAQSNFSGNIFGLKYQITIGQTIATSNNLLQSMRGELKQWELIKGFTSMFNLVILKDKDNPTNFIIEPYKDIFIDNTDIKTHDWTSLVDISDINLKPFDLKKLISFTYAEDKDDYGKNVYQQATTSKYGDTEIDATQFTLLQGETKVEAKPYAATYIKPLFDNTQEIITPVIFKSKDDGEYEGYKNKPRICYDNGEITLTNHTIYLPAQNGLSSENSTKYLQFSHLSEIPTTNSTKDYNFGANQFIGVIGNTPTDNLFNFYWAPYYDELYNADTRTLKIKVYLTPSQIANFNFYDHVQIKNRTYRVNLIEYKAGELSKVEFILIG